MWAIFYLLFLFSITPAFSEDGCATPWIHPRKNVVCYFEGKRPISTLNVCLCTHLIYTDIGLNSYGQLDISNGVRYDLEAARTQNPRLKVMVSLGGQAIKASTFSSFITDLKSLNNLTSSINKLYRDGIVDGVELDWEWPFSNGKKDRIKLIRYARQIKIAVGEEVVTRRARLQPRDKREAEPPAEEEFEEEYKDLEIDINTTERDLNQQQQDDDEAVTSAGQLEQSSRAGLEQGELSTTGKKSRQPRILRTDTYAQQNNKRRRPVAKVVKKRVRVAKARQTVFDELGLNFDDLDDLQSLVDQVLSEKQAEEGFLIFLRLSPIPQYLVEGYDFKMLNRFVNYYTLPTHNFTSPSNNVTYHHSRLMGVSDIENADSLLDIVTSLGADEEKIILAGTAKANRFNLLDVSRNTPGSASVGMASTITYQQVCKTLRNGNWTVEREEDMTGPYAFDDVKSWMAFDDSTSLIIKTKYAILRNLGGMALFSIDADDMDNICGQGELSLLKAIFKTMTKLDRKPRQLIVHSLEQDLVASPQTLSPVGVNVSPSRIVRVVDREGRITGLREKRDTTLECTRQGYYRHPQDCSQFYRCVKFNQYDNDYTIFEYGCPEGLVFDDRWEVCVWPSQATPCDGSSEIRPVPQNPYVCGAEGFFVDPENCRWFFACLDHKGNGDMTHYEFRCPFGLAFDEVNLMCNWPWLVPACGGSGAVPPSALRNGKAFGGGAGRGQGSGFRGNGLPIRGPASRPAATASPRPSSNGLLGGSFESSSPARQPVRQPVATTARPFASTSRPFASTARPFASTARPFASTARPFVSSTSRPFAEEPRAPAIASTSRRPAFASTSRRPAFQSTSRPTFASTSRPAFASTTSRPRGSKTAFIDECVDCESAGLNIRGQGILNPSLGIETFRGGHGAPVAGLPAYGTPTPSPSPSPPAYVSSTPAAPPAYVSSSPQPPYSPDYVDSPYYGEDEPGYSYPVPAHPLALPTRVPSISGITPSSHADSGHIADAANGANYVVPSGISSTYRPDLIQTPAPIPAYGVSSTYGTPLAPVTPLPSYGAPAEYEPAPPAPLPVSYPSSTYAPSPAPTPYAPPSPTPTPYQPAPAAYPSSTYQPSYPSSTYQPSYQSTTAKPISYPSTTAQPSYPSPSPLPSYGAPAPAADTGYSYPVPENPLVLPESDKGGFRPGRIETGFRPIGGSSFGGGSGESRRPKVISQNTGSFRPGPIETGFTPIPGSSQRRPNSGGSSNPRRPNQAFGSAEGSSFVSSVTNAVVDFVSTTVAPFINAVPAFTTARPPPARRPPPPIQNEVASVIPSGFSSATLSNGPNSISGRPSPFRPRPSEGFRNSNSNRFVPNNNNRPRPPPPPPTRRPSIVSTLFGPRPSSPFSRPGPVRPGPPNAGRPASNSPAGQAQRGGRNQRPGSGNGNSIGGRPAPSNAGNNRPAPPRPSPGAGAGGNRPSSGFFGGNNRPAPARPGFGNGNGPAGRPGPGNGNGSSGRPGFGNGNGPAGRPGSGNGNGPAGRPGSGGGNGRPGFGGGNGGRPGPSTNQDLRGGRQRPGFPSAGARPGPAPGRGSSRFRGQDPRAGRNNSPGNSITTVTRPNPKRPAVLNKLQGNDWNKFGPGGFRSFNDTIGPEVCERPGLFRHPTDCGKFYECYYDKWIDKYTLHVFPCPVVLGFDSGIKACNMPFNGPQCQSPSK